MNIRTAYLVPMIAPHTYRLELWTGALDVKEIIRLPHDFDALEVISDMLMERHPDIVALDTRFDFWTGADRADGDIPAWCTRSIRATVNVH